jgi:hypothetical protein
MIIKENIITSHTRLCILTSNNKPYWIMIANNEAIPYWEKATIIG